MGRSDLIGNSKQHLIPTYQPAGTGSYQSARKKNSTADGDSVKRTQKQTKSNRQPSNQSSNHPPKGRVLTQHTGLPPRKTGENHRKGR